MDNSPLVSIITPAFNSVAFIGDTIKSVQDQAYQNWEMIIVDDCSKDNTCQIVEQFAKTDSRIRLIRHPQNMGPARSRNTAIETAKGRYIAFLDSDDIWLPTKLAEQTDFMGKHECAVSCTAYKKIDENGKIISSLIEVSAKTNYQKLLFSNVIGNLTTMYDVEKLGKVYLPLVKHEDYGLWLTILKMGYEAYGLNECLALYRVRTNSVSGDKMKAASYQWKIYRELEKLPLRKSISYFVRYAYYGYVKFKR